MERLPQSVIIEKSILLWYNKLINIGGAAVERVYAFTDESGAFGWDLDNPSVSSHFIIAAIIVKESDLEIFTQKAEALRKKHFQTGEIKSSKIGGAHDRRVRILADLQGLPFNIFAVCIDKKVCQTNMNSKGLQYKKTFYKFMNNIVHKELRRAFKQITVVADEIGGSEYMQSFCQYVNNHQDLPDLFGDAQFCFQNSKEAVCIQIADLVSGTLSYVYDRHKRSDQNPDYYQILKNKIIRIELYPKTYDTYILENSAIADDYDEDIAKLCFAQAVKFVEHNSDSDDSEVQAQVAVVKYLLFRFMNNDTRGYIYSRPYIKLYGSGTVALLIQPQGRGMMISDLDEYIEIDSELMNCFKDTILKNDKVKGTEFPVLKPGVCTIICTGDVTRIEVIPRWCCL